MEGVLVGRKDAEVDDAGGEPLALGVDGFGAVGDVGGVERGDAAIDREQTARARRVGAHQLGTHDMERPQFHPGIPRLRRVNMSRHAMRTATPISTCSVIVERAGSSAMLLSISTPRFIGPGCMTMASGLAFSRRLGVG